jgi:hypothetical protein
MKRFFAVGLALFLLSGVLGCEKKQSEVKTQEKVTTPEGTRTETHTDKVETSGENPPARP